MALVDRYINDFLQEIKKLDPELRHHINMSEGLFHVQMGDFRAWLSQSIADGRLEDYEQGIGILDRYFQPMNKKLEEFNNPVYVSFLEHLFFDGENGTSAWERTPTNIQEQYTYTLQQLEKSAPKLLQHSTRRERFQHRNKKISRQS